MDESTTIPNAHPQSGRVSRAQTTPQNGNSNGHAVMSAEGSNSKRNAPESDRAKIARAARYKERFLALKQRYDVVTAESLRSKYELEAAQSIIRRLQDENDLLIDQVAMDIDYQPGIVRHLYPQTPELNWSTIIPEDVQSGPIPGLNLPSPLVHPPPPPQQHPAERRHRSSRRYEPYASSTNGNGHSSTSHRPLANGRVSAGMNGSPPDVEPKSESEPSVLPPPPPEEV